MFKKTKFWSLIELTIILTVLSILCAILAPVIDRYVRNAKVIRCREDVQAIGCAITMFIEDTANSYFMQEGMLGDGDEADDAPDSNDDNVVMLAVSDGDIPTLNATDGDATWLNNVNFEDVDFLEYHLVTNTPGNDYDHAYRTPTDLTNDGAIGDLGGGPGAGDCPGFARDSSGGFNSEFAWRGPYITAPIDPDPWGNRYGVNCEFLDPQADSENTHAAKSETDGIDSCGWENDVVVLSAGPDEEIDTGFAVDGLTPGDDDILYTLSGNSRP